MGWVAVWLEILVRTTVDGDRYWLLNGVPSEELGWLGWRWWHWALLLLAFPLALGVDAWCQMRRRRR